MPRIEKVLNHSVFAANSKQQQQQQQTPVFAIGASSGGAFAAQLVAEPTGIVQAGLVMVMSIPNNIIPKLVQKLIYLEPMPRDKGRTRLVIQNYNDLVRRSNNSSASIILDTTSCVPLPVTIEYLIQRVPGMNQQFAKALIGDLKLARHLDESSNLLLVDPTRSNWRQIVSPGNDTYWMDQFALRPGYSPLAKALHRAWAL